MSAFQIVRTTGMSHRFRLHHTVLTTDFLEGWTFPPLFFDSVLDTLGNLHFCINFRISISNPTGSDWVSGWDSVESIGWFGENPGLDRAASSCAHTVCVCAVLGLRILSTGFGGFLHRGICIFLVRFLGINVSDDVNNVCWQFVF
jgi:hypothetical protein